MPTAPTSELTGLLLDGRYQLQHVLGAGGYATVYLALDRRLHDREVAVKVLHPEHLGSAAHVARFAREIKVAARIGAGCEHLVKISDHGRWGDPPLLYFVMEYLAGPSLRQLLLDPAATALAGRRVQRPLPWPRAVTLALQLCAALTALHRHGVVHRDIKPENLIIDTSGIGDLLKLLDYGIAGLAPDAAISSDGPRTGMQHALGTPRYMAPEQLHGGDCDHRIDLYAAGAVLAELLTGEPPGPPGGPPLAAPSRRRPDAEIPAALDDVVLRATAWDPAARFADAEALSAALIRVLRDSAAAAAAEDATTLAVRGALTRATALTAHEPVAVNEPGRTVVAAAPAAARPAANPAARDRLLSRLGRLAGFTLQTSAVLSALTLVFALFTVMRNARSQAPGPADRLLREDRVHSGPAELTVLTGPARPAPPPGPAPASPGPEPPIRDLPRPVEQPPEAPTSEPSPPVSPPAEAPTSEPSPPASPPPEAPTSEPSPPASPPTIPPAAPVQSPPPAAPPARTIEQIVRAAERKIRARCGARGGDRMVEYTLVFVPGTVRLSDVRVAGEHQGRELGDCVEMAARAIDFTGARDRVNELPRALYNM